MSNEDAVKVFKPFERLDAVHSHKHEGTGLALYICKKLVEIHGGKINLKSTVGKGTSVTVKFPPERTVYY